MSDIIDLIAYIAPIMTVVLLLILVFRNPHITVKVELPVGPATRIAVALEAALAKISEFPLQDADASKMQSDNVTKKGEGADTEEVIVSRLIALSKSPVESVHMEAITALSTYLDNERAAQHLSAMSNHSVSSISNAAIRSLSKSQIFRQNMHDETAVSCLIDICFNDKPESDRIEAIKGLANFRHIGRATAALVDLAFNPGPDPIRQAAIRALGASTPT